LEQRFVFNQVADLYDRARVGYPEALFDDLMTAAALSPGDAMLEIGSGTGKATEDFARRGLDIVALEPGGEMIVLARRRLAAFSNVRFLQTTLEAWPVEPGRFKLIAAAQSWHWLASELRFTKAFEALAPGGALAVFGSTQTDIPSPLREALGRTYALHAPTVAGPPPEAVYLPNGPFAGYFERSGLFGRVLHKGYVWSRRYSAQSYVEYLRSVSRYQLLEAARRETLLANVAKEIETHGGSFDLGYETHLYLASRKG
jgi:ubiquinone/menaquinone biosynthesis C-methylase UbiE